MSLEVLPTTVEKSKLVGMAHKKRGAKRRLRRIADYVPPKSSHVSVVEYNGKKRKLSKGRLVEKLPGCTFHVLRNQCQHIDTQTNDRCQALTTYDYRLCDYHLLRNCRLMVAKSRIPGAGLGLYAVDPRLMPRFKLSLELPRDPPPIVPRNTVFQRGDIIGGRNCTFAGEILTNADYDERYTSVFGEYVIEMSKDNGYVFNHDEVCARTCLSYSNDGVNVRDILLRRNYIDRTGTHAVWHDTTWPHVINAYCSQYGHAIANPLSETDPYDNTFSSSSGSDSSSDSSGESDLDTDIDAESLSPSPSPNDGDELRSLARKDFACLQAAGDIAHGEEILWSYTGLHGPSRRGYMKGDWVKNANNEIRDGYWYTKLQSDAWYAGVKRKK